MDLNELQNDVEQEKFKLQDNITRLKTKEQDEISKEKYKAFWKNAKNQT